jgi:hypothetical protein
LGSEERVLAFDAEPFDARPVVRPRMRNASGW